MASVVCVVVSEKTRRLHDGQPWHFLRLHSQGACLDKGRL